MILSKHRALRGKRILRILFHTILVVVGLGLLSVPKLGQAKNLEAEYDCSDQTHIPQAECLALIDFYYSTEGGSWLDKTGWFIGDPCGWYGVTCNSTNVTTLDLDSNNVAGVLPTSIGNFPSLTIFSMLSNSIGGTIPSQIGLLTNVYNMLLDGNNFTGPLPTEIGDMDSLQYLYLNSNQLTGPLPSTLGDLPALHSLFLAFNDIDGSIPAEIGLISTLDTLHLMGNLLTGNVPPQLGNLTNLDTLILAYNNLDGPLPQELTQLTGLTSFNYGNTFVCEPQNALFQDWLAAIPSVGNIGIAPCVASILFEDDFESGDLLQWTRFNDGSGFLSACTSGAINGTYGACVERGTNDKRKQLIDDTPAYESTFSARFNFDINSLSMSEGERFRFMQFKWDAERPAFIVLKYQGGNYYIQLNTLLDDLTKVKTGWYLLSDAETGIEVDWQQSSGPSANDGSAELLINDISVETLSGLDNFSVSVSSFRMGFTSKLAGKSISGTFYIDDVATSTSAYIGLP